MFLDFVKSYVQCALWSSYSDEDVPLDRDFSTEDIAPETWTAIYADCTSFYAANADDLADVDDSQAGHDFWLTRNRHGAGFWDRGLGDVGSRLTDAAHSAGEQTLYVGDDGQLYVS